jgi:hypothetical protein
MNIEDIDPNHKMKINKARVQADGTQLWFVSFTTSPVRDGEQQFGYYQNYYHTPVEYDILDTYNNFLAALNRVPVK